MSAYLTKTRRTQTNQVQFTRYKNKPKREGEHKQLKCILVSLCRTLRSRAPQNLSIALRRRVVSGHPQQQPTSPRHSKTTTPPPGAAAELFDEELGVAGVRAFTLRHGLRAALRKSPDVI